MSIGKAIDERKPHEPTRITAPGTKSTQPINLKKVFIVRRVRKLVDGYPAGDRVACRGRAGLDLFEHAEMVAYPRGIGLAQSSYFKMCAGRPCAHKVNRVVRAIVVAVASRVVGVPQAEAMAYLMREYAEPRRGPDGTGCCCPV